MKKKGKKDEKKVSQEREVRRHQRDSAVQAPWRRSGAPFFLYGA